MLKAILPLITASLVGCGGGDSSSTPTSQLKVALVTDTGKINDGTFNESAYKGGIRASKELGLKFDYKEAASKDGFNDDISYFVDQGYNMIITVGFQMLGQTKTAAEKYPDVKFAIVDVGYDEYPDNLNGLLFAEDEAGYLAGTLAASVTTAKKVGVVGGMSVIPPVQRFVNGYVNGVLAACPTCTATCTFIESFTAGKTGAKVAEDMIAAGADVIFGAGGPTGSGGVLAATKKGKYGIGVDTDEYYTTYKAGAETSSTLLLSSAIKNIEEAVFQAIKSESDGKFEAGTLTFKASNDGVGLSAYHSDAVTDAVKAKVDTVLKGLADGSVKTGVAAGGANEANPSITCQKIEEKDFVPEN